MTKKELKWRLSELPTGGEVADLVSEGVITKEEARDILFNEEDKVKVNKVKELEEEVKFLRELCDKLAVKSNGWTTIIREYERYTPHYPYWYNRYGTFMNANTYTTGSLNVANSVNTVQTAGAVGGGTMTMTSTSSPTKLLSKLN